MTLPFLRDLGPHTRTLALLSLGLLLLALLLLGSARWYRQDMRQQFAAARQLHAQALQAAQLSARRALLDDEAQALLGQLQQQDFRQGQWGERLFDIRQETLGRHEVNTLLQDTEPASDRIFGAESLEFSVQSPAEDLFTAPADAHGGMVVVSLQARLLFRTGLRTPTGAHKEH